MDADHRADDDGHDDHPDRLHGEIPVLVAEQPADEEARRAAEPHAEVPGDHPQDEEQQHHRRPREPVLQQVVDDEFQHLGDGPLDSVEESLDVGGQPEDDLLGPQTERDLPGVEVLVVPEARGERAGPHRGVSCTLPSGSSPKILVTFSILTVGDMIPCPRLGAGLTISVSGVSQVSQVLVWRGGG